MYLPAPFTAPAADELHRLIAAHPLGMLVAQTTNGLDAVHIPFLFDPARADAMHAHVARANPFWQQVADGAEVLVVFRGVDGYMSPNWYPSKAETHRHVPTWNYEVVHVHGRLRIRDDMRFVRGVVARLTRVHEAAQPVPWKMGDAPADYLDEQLAKNDGLEVEVTRMEGKRKLSQNRDARDFAAILQALEEGGQHALAAEMARTRD